MRKIVIGTPWTSAFMHTPWVDAALRLRAPAGHELDWVRGLGWCDARRIHYIIEHALAEDADVVVFLDADVIVPPEWLELMTKHLETGIRAVASVVPMRGRAHEQYAPFEMMAWNVLDGELVPVERGSGLQKVDYVAMGASMFDVSIFREHPSPWTWHEHGEGYKAKGSTADSIFIKNLRELGIEVFADPSVEVKHLHTFQIDQTYESRFPEWEVGGA